MMYECECELCENAIAEHDAVVDGKPMKICHKCALTNDALILQKPTSEQIKESQRLFTVKEVLHRAAGIRGTMDKTTFVTSRNAPMQQSVPVLRTVPQENSIAKRRWFQRHANENVKIKDIKDFRTENKIDSGLEIKKQRAEEIEIIEEDSENSQDI